MLTLKCCDIRPHEWSQWICPCLADMGLYCSHCGCCIQFCKITSYFLKGSEKGVFPASRKEENTSHWLIWPGKTPQCLQWMKTLDWMLANPCQLLARKRGSKGTTVLTQNQLWGTNCAHGVWADALKTPCFPSSHPKRATLLCLSPGPPWCSRAVAFPAVN